MKNGWSPCQQKKGKRPNTVSRVLRTNKNLSSVGKVRKGVITSFRKCYLLQKKKRCCIIYTSRGMGWDKVEISAVMRA